jgi:Na+/proline symporter
MIDLNQISFLCLVSGFLALGAFKSWTAFLNLLRTNKKTTKDPKQFEILINSYSSFNSVITYVGFVTETYYYGARLLMNIVAASIGYVISLFLLQPLFYDLQIKSPYEYLQKRYANRIICRLISSFIGIIFHVSYSTLFLYGNATILSTIFRECDLALSIIIVGCLSALFALFGGFLQTVFVNFFQLLLFLFGALSALSIAIELPGDKLNHYWNLAKQDNRLNFIVTSGDLRTRYTIWNQLFSLPIPWCAFHAILVPNFTRFKQIKTKSCSNIFFISHLPLMFIINSIAVFTGIFCYITFYDCDPYLSKEFSNKNQLASYFLITVLNEKLPSIAGLFLASLFVYAIMQYTFGISLCGQIFIADILKPIMKEKIKTYHKILNFIKSILILCMTTLTVLFSFALKDMDRTIANFFFIFNISINSPIAALFFLSIFNPYANHVGAFSSFLINLSINLWLLTGTLTSTLKPQSFPQSTHGCNTTDLIILNRNITYSPQNEVLFYFYSLSPIWYSLFSLLFVTIFGSLISLIYSLIAKKTFDLDENYASERKKYLFNLKRHKFCIKEQDEN